MASHLGLHCLRTNHFNADLLVLIAYCNGQLLSILIYCQNFYIILVAAIGTSADPDDMPHCVASHLGLYCLPTYYFDVNLLIVMLTRSVI